MRIISKFHDYYDSGMAHGQDQSVVYLRDTKEYDFNHLTDNRDIPQIIKDIRSAVVTYTKMENPLRWERNFFMDTNNNKNRFFMNVHKILFCGKVYTCVQISTRDLGYLNEGVDTFMYDAESVIKFLEKNSIDVDNKRYSWDTTKRERINSWFVVKQPDREWLIANKITNVAVSKSSVIVNPRLQNYNFAKCLDAYSAYQELDMWISGTLSYPQNFMVEVSDKSKIQKHGFDTKYGFRKRPQEA
jgi:hypothetical protein